MAELLIFLFFMSLMFAGIGALQAWQKSRSERLRILEDALRNDSIDAETKREILQTIQPRSGKNKDRLLFAVGWIGLFVGIGMLLSDERDMVVPGAMFAAIGFGLITMPIAYREIEARRSA